MAENTTKKSNKKTEATEETALRLEWQPHTFEAYGKTTRIALSKLASSISDQFKQSFNDYLGTNIVFNGRNFEVTLIFEKGRSLNNNTDGDKKMDNLDDNFDYMITLAERDAINRFTTAEIKVEMVNNNAINNDQDIDGIIGTLSSRLREELGVVAAGVHY